MIDLVIDQRPRSLGGGLEVGGRLPHSVVGDPIQRFAQGVSS